MKHEQNELKKLFNFYITLSDELLNKRVLVKQTWFMKDERLLHCGNHALQTR